MNAKKLMALAVICVAAASPSLAGLVARWDFNNYDPSNPTSAAIPCTGTTASTEVTDGTLGSITVVNTGLPEGDYALSIPKGAHLKVPLPSGIVHDKSWSMRIRFYYPGTANTLNVLVSGEYTGVGNGIWYVSGKNLIQGWNRWKTEEQWLECVPSCVPQCLAFAYGALRSGRNLFDA